MPKTVLVVEDSVARRDICTGALKELEIEPLSVDSGAAALSVLEDGQVDIVLAGMEIQNPGGIELLKSIKQKFPDVDVVMMASSGSTTSRTSASS